jgi:hypothetical protein
MNPANIKKNDPILVTRQDGRILAAKATKVGPWSKNPKITLVNYIFTDPKDGLVYTSKSDARKCSMGTNDMLPKEPEPAKTHPIMAKWTLGKTKRGPMMMEGYYFAVPVLLHGKKTGEVIDEGNGGSVMTRFDSHEVGRLFEADCREWCKVNGASMSYLEAESEFWSWWDEARPQGIDASTYFENSDMALAKLLAAQKPITNSDAFAKAVNGA